MAIKVLQVINILATGGAELMVKRLALGFDRTRVECDIVAICEAPADADKIFRSGTSEQGIRTLSLDKQPGRKDLAALWRLARLIRSGRYDVVHMHCPSPSVYGRIASLLAPGTSRVVTIHNLMNASEVRFEKFLAPLTDCFIACSPESHANLLNDCQFSEDKVRCIFNGTGSDRTLRVSKAREDIRRDRGVAPGEQVGIVLARLEQQKAHLDLLEALVQPGERIGKLKLWLVGNDRTPYGDEVRRSIAEKGLEARVEILGRVADNEVDELMKGADLFLLPSHREGMSVAVLEAMAAALPTVISDLETNREVTQDGRFAWLTPIRDPVGLAAALNELLSAPDEMKQRAQDGALYVQERFSFDRVVEEYSEVYEELRGE